MQCNNVMSRMCVPDLDNKIKMKLFGTVAAGAASMGSVNQNHVPKWASSAASLTVQSACPDYSTLF